MSIQGVGNWSCHLIYAHTYGAGICTYVRDTALLLSEPIGSLEGCSLAPSPFQGHQKQPLGERACDVMCVARVTAGDSRNSAICSCIITKLFLILHLNLVTNVKVLSIVPQQLTGIMSSYLNAALFGVIELLYQFRNFRQQLVLSVIQQNYI